jgi:hypothetical protein
MKKLLAVPCALVGVLLALSLFTSPASAQATRTWVSGVGDDANPCSRTAPCKTFAGAISKTLVNGEIDCLDPGGFGAVTITKSITLDCSGTFGSILFSGTNGINIPFDSFSSTDTRKTVNIRGISFQGVDSGLISISLSGNGTGSFVNVEDCVINGNFGGAATGINDQRTNGTLTVLNSTVRDMGTAGVSITSTGGGLIRATLSNVRVINANSGIVLGAGAGVHVSRSVMASNSTVGLSAAVGASLSIDSTEISNNGLGLKSLGTVILSTNDFAFNITGLSGSVFTYTSSRFTGNGSGGTFSTNGTASEPTGQQ